MKALPSPDVRTPAQPSIDALAAWLLQSAGTGVGAGAEASAGASAEASVEASAVASVEASAVASVEASAVASVVVNTWQDIDAALTPVIGPRGVAALFNRSVQLASLKLPALEGTGSAAPTTMELSPLKLRLANQNPNDAAAAGALLLHTFHQLLGSLIGAALTEQLLRRVWPSLLNSTPQDSRS